MTKTPTAIAFYLRVSRKSQEVDSQLEAIREFCRRQGWPLPKRGTLFMEKASGRNTKRTELDRLLHAVRNREFDCIVCWRLDRMGRSHVHMVNVHEELRNRGIRVIGVGDQLDTLNQTAALIAFQNMLGVLAQFQAEQGSENVLAGLAAAKKRGKYPGRPKTKTSAIDAALAALQRVDPKTKKRPTLRAVAARYGVSFGYLCDEKKKRGANA